MIGAVLAGGASVRFGSDKAVADWLGMPLASRSMRALYGAGAEQLLYVSAHQRDEGTFVLPTGARSPTHVIDDHPGEGPLGAIVSVLRFVHANHPTSDTVVVAACDLPSITTSVVAAMEQRLSTSDIDLVVPRAAGHLHWSLVALRNSTCRPVLERAFERGERAVHRAAAPLRRVEMDVDDRFLVNANEPHMIPRSSLKR